MKLRYFLMVTSVTFLFTVFTINNLFSIDHNSFNLLLKKNVKNGAVNYSGFKTKEMDDYLDQIAKTNVSSLNRNAKLAFYLNAYNAICIKQVLDNYDQYKNSSNGVLSQSNFFDQVSYSVAGQKVSLNQLENSIIRPTFKEPLIHFGLVCAAKGCPSLSSEAFTEGNVITLLKKNTTGYLSSQAGLRVDKSNKIIYISMIFNWYRQDFGENVQEQKSYAKGSFTGVRKFIGQYRSDLKSVIDDYDIGFIDYNWQLNKQ